MVQNFHLIEVKKEDLSDIKNRERFIDLCLKVLKSSFEYKKYKEYLDISSRGTFPKVEQHFTPFFLSDVVDIIITKKESENKQITEFLVTHELMQLLYKGIIPNCFIPYSDKYAITFGKSSDYIYNKDEFKKFTLFIEEYLPYMSERYNDKLRLCIARIEGKRTRDEKKKELIDILEKKIYNIHSDTDELLKDKKILIILSSPETIDFYRDLADLDRCPKNIKKDINTLCSMEWYNSLRLCDCKNIENCWKKYLKDDFEKDVNNIGKG